MNLPSLNEITILYAIALHSLIAITVLDRKILRIVRRKVRQKVLSWPVPLWLIKLVLSISPPLLLRLLNVDPVMLQRHRAGQPVALSQPAWYYVIAGLRMICPQLLWKFGDWVARLPRIRKYVLFCGKSRVVKFLRRNDFVQHWTVQQVVLLLTFLAANTVCVFLKFSGLSDAGRRSGRLAVINFVALYAGPHLSFLADALNVPLSTYRHLHSSASLVVLFLALFHVIVAVLDPGYSPSYVLKHKFALIAVLSLVFQSALFSVLRRVLWYEVALRFHQANAVLLAYAVARHISSEQMMYVYSQAALFLAASATQLTLVLWRHSCKPSLATVKLDQETVRVSLSLPKQRALKIEAGQYINLWMPLSIETGGYRRLYKPFISTRSAWQSHPFTVVSWSKRPQRTLELVVKPQNGWTRRLFIMSELAELRALRDVGTSKDFQTVAMFSGPHGAALSTHGYQNILVLAQTFGILSCIPFLRKIMDEYGGSTVERVHLVYEAETFYNGEESIGYFIDHEFLGRSQNFKVTMFVTQSYIKNNVLKKSERAIAHNGRMPIHELLNSEITTRRPGSKTLILTSLSPGYQDSLYSLVNQMLDENMDVVDSIR